MSIVHLAAECYPIAKVGGLADVVGALPKYQNHLSVSTIVIMPFYDNAFTQEHEFDTVFSSELKFGTESIEFSILKLKHNQLGFEVFFVNEKSINYTYYKS